MSKHALLTGSGLLARLLFLGDAASFYHLGFAHSFDAKLQDEMSEAQ